MDFTQTTFLGASIRSFNASLGWQNQVSQLSVSLVEDSKNSDNFTDPVEGTPVIFTYDAWTFEGIIQSKKLAGNSSGNPVYDVVVVDPRELLDGASLIIDAYNGTVNNVPNLINVFGFIENTDGFGSSKINEAGMPWKKIRDAATTIINSNTESIYGGPIQFKGFNYQIDIHDLPEIPEFYRVAGNVITLMDFVNDICTAGGHDFFFELVGNTIKLITIDRRSEPIKGAIARFVATTNGAVSKDVGIETRNEVTSKFVVGDSVKAMFAQFPADNKEDDFTDDTIWPYWGLLNQQDIDAGDSVLGEPIIGEGFDDAHTFTLDSRHLDLPGIGSTYVTNIAEMRAAVEGQESWENFLENVNDRKFQFSQPWPIAVDKNGDIIFIRNQDRIQISKNNYTERVLSIFRKGQVRFEWNSGNIRRTLSKRGKKVLGPIAKKEMWDEWDARKIPPKYYGPNDPEPVPNNVAIDARMYELFLKDADNLLKYSNYYEPIRENQVVECRRVIEREYYDKDGKKAKKKILKYGFRAGQEGECFIGDDAKKNAQKIAKKLQAKFGDAPIANPHFMKASRMGLVGNFSSEFAANLSDFTDTGEDIAKMNILKNSPFTKGQIDAIRGTIFTQQELVKNIYDFVFRYADQYYGKKFMVRIPFVLIKKDDVTNEITTSQEPTDGGFIDEDDFDEALNNNLIPLRTTKLTLQDGRFEAYVRFDHAHTLNLEELDEQDFVFSQDLKTIFIKCDVDPNIIFLDKDTGFSPRVVITLPARLTLLGEGTSDTNNAINMTRLSKAKSNHGDSFILLESAIKVRDPSLTDNQVANILKRIYRKPGADIFSHAKGGISITPSMVAIPLRSNTQVYGPWFAVGAQGKVEFEQDTNLVPWNFDGFSLLNEAGNSRVINAITSQTFGESGSITFPDTPSIKLGRSLINDGPYITNIQLSIGPDGITTTYQMQTWTNKFGKITKANVDRQQRQAKANQAERRRLRGEKKAPPSNSKYYQKRKSITHKRNTSNSSHGILIGNAAGDSDISSNVFIQPAYHSLEQISEEYNQTSVMSLDGMFRPFSAWIDYSGDMPNFQAPVSGAIFPTIDDLNPFPRVIPASDGVIEVTRCDISILAIDETVPDVGGLITEENQGALDGNYRPLALRGPLVICGWGYDTDGRPVPNLDDDDNSSNQFASGYLENYSTWPVGPVDLKWSHKRQLWQTGTDVLEGYLLTTLTEASGGGAFPGEGTMQPWQIDSNGEWNPDGASVDVLTRDPSFKGTTGAYIQVVRFGTEFRPFYVECST